MDGPNPFIANNRLNFIKMWCIFLNMHYSEKIKVIFAYRCLS